MPRYVAFLRGINLGRRRLPMSRLRGLFEELNYQDVATFIASGNVIFTDRRKSSATIESTIATYLEAALGYEVDTFVRTSDEVMTIATANIFNDQDAADVNVHVSFMHEKLPAATAKKLAAIRTETDHFYVSGREFYWRCVGRMSDSLVWTLPEVKALQLPTSTMRNMNTLRKLSAKFFTASTSGDGEKPSTKARRK